MDHLDNQKRISDDGILKAGVIMLSAGGISRSTELVEAFDAAYEAGMHNAISAGDLGSDACASGAGHTRGLVDGATTLMDEGADFSNLGICVELFALGHGLLFRLYLLEERYRSIEWYWPCCRPYRGSDGIFCLCY